MGKITNMGGVAFFVALSPGRALAASEGVGAASSEATFVAEIILLLLVGRLLGEAMQRIGQPPVMGQLIAGMLLGPSVFGAIWPQAQQAIFPTSGEQKSMIDAVSQLGILMLLLLTGMETDLNLARRVGRAAITTSAAGIALPFVFGFVLGEFLPDWMLPNPDQRLVTAIFLGTALSIASVKIVAMVVREMDFMRRNVGQIIIASAIIDDTVGWIIIAITFSLAAHGSVDAAGLARSVLGTALFLLASFTIGRRLVFALIRWTNDNFVSEVPVITTILVLMGTMALITHAIGVHSVLGAFVAGILIGESPILTRHIDEQLRGLITALFMPVFFGLAGLSANLTVLKAPDLALFTVFLILVASVGKFAGAFLGGTLGGLTRPESLALACGMNARGSTEIIVASIGLSMGALTQDLFTMIVAMAVVTTMAMPPMLRWALLRLPIGEEERQRLEREAVEAEGFVTNLERLLLAVDDSANGKFAARLAGLIAGPRGIPTTLVSLGPGDPTIETAPPATKSAKLAVKAAAKEGEPESRRTDHATVEVSKRSRATSPAVAVASEARKGYDLLIIGAERMVALQGGFHEDVERVAAAFQGPLAIVAARGAHLARPLDGSLSRLLVPVTGTNASRRAAEVALALVRATSASMTALYVLSTTGVGAERGRPRRPTPTRRYEEAILKGIVEMADRYGTVIHTALRPDIAPEDAILRQARVGRHDLIVMGVNRRPGETLFFGKVAAAVLENSERSILFVST
jgi:Kef-type K+ transport system membrane component KefB/nucleotide-binding universal stress UspA family protein